LPSRDQGRWQMENSLLSSKNKELFYEQRLDSRERREGEKERGEKWNQILKDRKRMSQKRMIDGLAKGRGDFPFLAKKGEMKRSFAIKIGLLRR